MLIMRYHAVIFFFTAKCLDCSCKIGLRKFHRTVQHPSLIMLRKHIHICQTLETTKVPEVILNEDDIPMQKDGQEEREYDPEKLLPLIHVRVSAPNGISAVFLKKSTAFFTLYITILL